MVEYGVARADDSLDSESKIHRSQMTKAEAVAWIQEWENMGGDPDLFYVVSRELPNWQKESME